MSAAPLTQAAKNKTAGNLTKQRSRPTWKAEASFPLPLSFIERSFWSVSLAAQNASPQVKQKKGEEWQATRPDNDRQSDPP
jgi:hypothetical protein